MKSSLQLPLWFAILMLASCANLQQLSQAQKPTAAVTSVAVANLSLTSITLNARINLDNPNPFPLTTAGLTLDLAIAGQSLAQIQQPDTRLTLPASGSTTTELPIVLRFKELFAAADHARQQNEVPYGLSGKIRIQVPVLGEIAIPLEYEDVLPVPRLPDVQLKDVELLEAGFSQIKLQLQLALDNPNSFALTLQQLGFNLQAMGKTLSSAEPQSVTLEAGEQQTVSLPISLRLSDVGAALLHLLNSDQPTKFIVVGLARLIPALQCWQAEALTFRSERLINL